MAELTLTNPYTVVGEIHNAGLTHVVNYISNAPTLKEVVSLGNSYMKEIAVKRPCIEPYCLGSDALTTIAINRVVTFNDFIANAGLNPAVTQKIEDLLRIIDELGDNPYEDHGVTPDIVYEFEKTVIVSPLTTQDQSLPLVGAAMFRASFEYWENVYSHPEGPWFKYITVTLGGEVQEITWKDVIKADLKAGIAALLESGFNLGAAAAAAVAASVAELIRQWFP